METIRYDVKAPDLRGKTNEQQALAIEEYVRETTRQMGIILRQLQDRAKALDQAVADGRQTLETEITEAVAASEARMGDYPVEVGTDGIWRYRKWASGDAECRGIARLTVLANGWTAAGNVFCADGEETLPDGLFVDTPDVIAAIQGSTNGNFAGWAGRYLPSSTETAKYRVYRHNNYTSTRTVQILLSCNGRWKTGGDDNGQ